MSIHADTTNRRPLRTLLCLVAVSAAVLTMSVVPSASALPRPPGPDRTLPDSGEEVAPDEETGQETEADAGSPTVPRPDRPETDPGPAEELEGDHAQAKPSPINVTLDVTVDGDEATATIGLVEIQTIVDPDVVGAPSPVSVDLVWGDGARAGFAVDGRHFGLEQVTHRYRVDETTDMTVFAYVTDDRGGVNIASERIVLEVLYDVALSDLTFGPYVYDCDGWLTGDGDFRIDASFSWNGTTIEDAWAGDLGDGETTAGLLPGGIAAERVSLRNHPSLRITWLEDDPGLDVPPRNSFDVAMDPDPALGSRRGHQVRRSGGCQVRVDFTLTTSLHR